MNGSAPNCSTTGSQVPDTRNLAPNFRSAGNDSRRRTAKSSTASARTTKAKNAEAFSNAMSFVFLPLLVAIPRGFSFSLKKERGEVTPPPSLYSRFPEPPKGAAASRQGSIQRLPVEVICRSVLSTMSTTVFGSGA